MEGGTPNFQTTEIPEAVFGRLIKDPDFRSKLLSGDPAKVLADAKITISDKGLDELKHLIDIENAQPSLDRKLADVQYW